MTPYVVNLPFDGESLNVFPILPRHLARRLGNGNKAKGQALFDRTVTTGSWP